MGGRVTVVQPPRFLHQPPLRNRTWGPRKGRWGGGRASGSVASPPGVLLAPLLKIHLKKKSYKLHRCRGVKVLMPLIRRGFRLLKASIILKSVSLKHQLTSSEEKKGFTLRLATGTRTLHNGAVCVGRGGEGVKVTVVGGFLIFYFLLTLCRFLHPMSACWSAGLSIHHAFASFVHSQTDRRRQTAAAESWRRYGSTSSG